jgi:hypothetical protein
LPRQFGEANYGFVTGTGEEFTVPLGAYSNIQSPWGLFDVSGASGEWVEEPFYVIQGGQLPTGRRLAGNFLTGSASDFLLSIGIVGGQSDPLDDAYWMGFRIAAAVPSPSISGAIGVIAITTGMRRRRE